MSKTEITMNKEGEACLLKKDKSSSKYVMEWKIRPTNYTLSSHVKYASCNKYSW